MTKQNEELREIVNGFHALNERLRAWLDENEKREILVSVVHAENPEIEKYKFEEFENVSEK